MRLRKDPSDFQSNVIHRGKDAEDLCLRYLSYLHFVQLGPDDGRGDPQVLKEIMKRSDVTVECRLESLDRDNNGEKGAIRHKEDQPVIAHIDEVDKPIAEGSRWRLVLGGVRQVQRPKYR